MDAALAKLSHLRESIRPAAQAVWAGTGRVNHALLTKGRELYGLARANPKDPRVLTAGGLALGGALLVAGVIALAVRSGKASDSMAQDAHLNARSAASATPDKPLTCKAARPALRIAPKVNKDIPLELLVAPDGSRTFIGFVTEAKLPRGVAIDRITSAITELPAGGAATDATTTVAPTLVQGKANLLVTTEKSGEPLRGARPLSLDPLTLIGQSDHALAVVTKPAGGLDTLWPLDGPEPIENLRALEVPKEGYAIAFRRHGSISFGWLDPARKPKGPLARIPDAGGPPDSGIGSPALAHNGLGAVVAFADRTAKTESWSVYVAAGNGTNSPAMTRKFAVPPGGPGGDAFAPRMAGLGAGRVLLVWTEGTGSTHDVRVQMLGQELQSLGAPFTVSRHQTNAGQGAVAIQAGKGIVAYLELSPEGYDMWGVPIECE